jgi:hypothetical protein
MNIYNNFIYKNWDFSDDIPGGFASAGIQIYNTNQTDAVELRREFKNNVSYGNFYEASVRNIVVGTNGLYTHNYNSWDTPPGVTVTDDDFVSLDYTQLLQSRKADGSLPDITFGKLVEDSDLRAAGVDVGLPFEGDAPDLGWAEYEESEPEPEPEPEPTPFGKKILILK